MFDSVEKQTWLQSWKVFHQSQRARSLKLEVRNSPVKDETWEKIPKISSLLNFANASFAYLLLQQQQILLCRGTKVSSCFISPECFERPVVPVKSYLPSVSLSAFHRTTLPHHLFKFFLLCIVGSGYLSTTTSPVLVYCIITPGRAGSARISLKHYKHA